MSVRLSVRHLFLVWARMFLTDGHRHLGICSNERSWCVDVSFDSFDQIRPPEIAEIGENVQNSNFFRNMSFPDCFFVTDGRRDLGVSLACKCTFWQFRLNSVTGSCPNLVETS